MNNKKVYRFVKKDVVKNSLKEFLLLSLCILVMCVSVSEIHCFYYKISQDVS